jgi:hypothetical protein
MNDKIKMDKDYLFFKVLRLIQRIIGSKVIQFWLNICPAVKEGF